MFQTVFRQSSGA